MAVTIRNENKLRLVKEMGQDPIVSGRDIATELNVTPVTVYRWMAEPDDYQTQRIMDAIKRIKERKAKEQQ